TRSEAQARAVDEKPENPLTTQRALPVLFFAPPGSALTPAPNRCTPRGRAPTAATHAATAARPSLPAQPLESCRRLVSRWRTVPLAAHFGRPEEKRLSTRPPPRQPRPRRRACSRSRASSC